MSDCRPRFRHVQFSLPSQIRGVAIFAALLAAGCSDSAADPEPPPAVVETVPGSDVKRLMLTEQAVARLGIATAAVAPDDSFDGADRSVPFAAILYEPDGDTWVYTNPTPLMYVREPVTVEDVNGDIAHLSSGPATGTPVVTVGVAELFGTENGIGQ